MGEKCQFPPYVLDPEFQYVDANWEGNKQDQWCKHCIEALVDYKIMFREERGPAAHEIPVCAVEEGYTKCVRCTRDSTCCEQATYSGIQSEVQSFVKELERLRSPNKEFETSAYSSYVTHSQTGKAHPHEEAVARKKLRKQRKLTRRLLATQTDMESTLPEISKSLRKLQKAMANN